MSTRKRKMLHTRRNTIFTQTRSLAAENRRKVVKLNKIVFKLAVPVR